MSASTTQSIAKDSAYYEALFQNIATKKAEVGKKEILDDVLLTGRIELISKGALDWVNAHQAEISEADAQELILPTISGIKQKYHTHLKEHPLKRLAVFFSRFFGFSKPYANCNKAEELINRRIVQLHVESAIEKGEFRTVKTDGEKGYLEVICSIAESKIQEMNDLSRVARLEESMRSAMAGEVRHQKKSLFYRISLFGQPASKSFDRVYTSVVDKKIELETRLEIDLLEKLPDHTSQLRYILNKVNALDTQVKIKENLLSELSLIIKRRGPGANAEQTELLNSIYEAARTQGFKGILSKSENT